VLLLLPVLNQWSVDQSLADCSFDGLDSSPLLFLSPLGTCFILD
jgi:hypothetical protein